jgi:hypothetical protein
MFLTSGLRAEDALQFVDAVIAMAAAENCPR